jgi:hypothetical protein
MPRLLRGQKFNVRFEGTFQYEPLADEGKYKFTSLPALQKELQNDLGGLDMVEGDISKSKLKVTVTPVN